MEFDKEVWNRVWWHAPVTLALCRLRQENPEFWASVGCRARPRLTNKPKQIRKKLNLFLLQICCFINSQIRWDYQYINFLGLINVLFILIFYLHAHVRVWSLCVGSCGGQKTASDPLELEFQEVVSHLTRVLGSEQGSLEEQQELLTVVSLSSPWQGL